MTRNRYGDRRACKTCGQDIEFHGKAHGWLDRGSGRTCSLIPDPDPYNRGEFIKPKRKTLHKPYKE